MLERVADLTWRRPKLVLALVGAFVIVSGALGLGVESHLKAAGFTDSASESERASGLLRSSLGYDPSPGIVVLLRAPGGGRLDLTKPAVRREVDRLAGQLAGVRHVGRVDNPLGDPRLARLLIAGDRRSLVLTGHLTSKDIEADGGQSAQDAKRLLHSRTLAVGIGGFAPGFSEVNDQTRSDLRKAELIAFPVLALHGRDAGNPDLDGPRRRCSCSSSAASSRPESRC